MNKNKTIELITSDIVAKNLIKDLEHKINQITTNLQTAKDGDIVFYKIHNEANVEDFYKRLKGKTPSLIILSYGSEKFIKDDNCLFIAEDNFLQVQKKITDEIYPNKNKLKIVGITGTNGKTTTANLSVAISAELGHRAFSIGTIGVFDENGPIYDDLESTTPSYVEIRKLIHLFQDKYEVCFMEVSSHALIQKRLFDLKLDEAAWMSFSQDHLDYHQTMEEYFRAKLLIESKYLKEGKTLIVPHFEETLYLEILKENPNAHVSKSKTLLERDIKDAPLFYKSKYNQSNVEVALELNERLWGEKISKINLEKIKTPQGRFSIIELWDNSMAIVDYAHTPDALLNIGKAIKEAFPTHKLTVVFGCGGNRDKTKRPKMGKACASFADKLIVTSDNPRGEAPEDILLDIISGINIGYEAMVDRKQAIEHALDECYENEIILIAGKGHEEYQEIKGVKYPFSDFKIVEDYIKEE